MTATRGSWCCACCTIARVAILRFSPGRMNDDELARVGDGFLEQIMAEGMTDAAMPNLALLLHQMSLSAAMWRPS